MKNIFIWILSGLVVCTSIYLIAWFSLDLSSNLSLKSTNIQRENYEHSQSYVEGKLNDLAKYKLEYERTEDPNEKEQIINYIYSQFSSFDENLINNSDLYKFLQDVRNGNLN